jgi:rhomboid protease GluP
MREKFINNIINALCSYSGYAVIQLASLQGTEAEWALVKNISMNKKRVIIFINKSYNIDESSLEIVLMHSLGCEQVDIVKLLLLDKTDINTLESDVIIQQNSNIAIISYEENKIVAYGQEAESTVYEIANIPNYKEQINKKAVKPKDRPWTTIILIAVNVVMYLITALLSGNILDSDINVLIFLGAKYNRYILSGEYYRLVTCMFLHGGLIHLVFNMYALYSIGPLVEKIHGRIKYLIIYFVSGIMSSLFSFIFSEGVSIGASGAIFGLLGTTLVFAVTMRKNIGKDFLRNISSVIIINLFIGLTMSNIDNYGHIGGLLGGAVIAVLLNIIRKSERHI